MTLLANPDASRRNTAARSLKNGNTCTVWSIPLDGRRLVVKRYNIKGEAHSIKRAVQRTRARVSWHGAHPLNRYGIQTPSPVAMVEKKFGPLHRQSYYISEFVPGEYCGDFFSSNAASLREKEMAAGRIIALFAALAAGQISHGDMKGTNILITNGQPVLIDLDGVRQHRLALIYARYHQKDKKRFLKTFINDPDTMRLFARLQR